MRINEIICEAEPETDAPDTAEPESTNDDLQQQSGDYTDSPQVRNLQSNLKKLGYNLGPPGVDGKYGPYTAAAVAAFKKDYKAGGNGSKVDAKTLKRMDKVLSGKIPRVKKPTAPESSSSVGELPESGDLNQARQVVEQFHGTPLTDAEWSMLVRATLAEASPHPAEQAGVMAVMLNRVRSSRWPNTIYDVLYDKNQFQAVTGTPRNRTPSPHYSRQPSQTHLSRLAGAIIKHLPSANRSWLNFTSAVSAAYGAGTNIAFMSKVANSPGAKKIGKTWFGTV